MKYFLRIAMCAIAALAVNASTVHAAVITFETTPAGVTPTDDAPLNAPYPIAGGNVAFFFDVNGNNAFTPGTDQLPSFERAGELDPNSGFLNNGLNQDDTSGGSYGSQLGTWFLRQLQPGTPPHPFIVDYNTTATITALSGEIWDIDGSPGFTEQWHVEVLDASNSLLAWQDSPLGNDATYDGLPWVFNFSGLSNPDKVRITFTGSKSSELGLAFNNFSPDAVVPEPSSYVLATLGLASVIAIGKRRSWRTADMECPGRRH